MSLPSSFTTVTPLSRLLALILFIILPLIAFYLGTTYGKTIGNTTKMASKMTNTVSTCVAQKACTDEAKECPNGSFVFRKQPNCDFSACPSLRKTGTTVMLTPLPITGKTKQEQITSQLSQKTGIPALEVIITYKNESDTKNTYDGGTYTEKGGNTSGRWIATKINGKWTVTSLSTGIPLCTDIDPYYYPKDIVPACKDAKNNIKAR